MEWQKLREAISGLFLNKPNPNDTDIHAEADRLGLNPHEFETGIYRFTTELLQGIPGKHKDTPQEAFDPDQLKIGVTVELEHTEDPSLAMEIAKDHLAEIPDYYTRLAKMEEDAKLEQPKSKAALAFSSEITAALGV